MSEITLVRHGWKLALDTFGEDAMKTWVTFFVHEFFYWGSFLPFLIASRIPSFRKWKVQEEKPEKRSDLVHCAWKVGVNHLCLVLPLIIVTHPIYAFLGTDHRLESLPSLSVIALQLSFYLIVEDFVFYFIHRFLHTPWLYKNIHIVHHQHSAPFGIAAEYAHPIEVVFLGFATFAGPFLAPPHLITLFAWLAIRSMQTIECHSGYDFPWSMNRWFPLYGGADFHDHHHRIHSGNYSSTFIWVDKLFGTDNAYQIWKASQRMRKKEAKERKGKE